MAEILFQLPKELIVHTLSFLEPDDVTKCFGLDEILMDTSDDPFLAIKHYAIHAKYLNRQVIMSNAILDKFSQLSITKLKYLIKHNIIINPKEISFVLFDVTKFDEPMKFFRNILQSYFFHLEHYTSNFSIQLILTENFEIDHNLIKTILEPFNSNNSKISWFTIKYNPIAHKRRDIYDGYVEEREMLNLPYCELNDFLDTNGGFNIENLKLRLFNSIKLINQLSNKFSCFNCNSLKTLDLSYNGLNDYSLLKINFPKLLNYLDLSNNNLCFVSNTNFNLTPLENLISLNIANNNIMKFRFNTNSLTFENNFKLRYLNLSGNNLQGYTDLFTPNNKIFSNLLEIDLSRNMIKEISPFPILLKSINLKGNYLTYSTHEMIGKTFPCHLHELHINFCRVLNDDCTFLDLVANILNSLYNLETLEVGGSSLDYSFLNNMSPSLQIRDL